MTDTEDQLAADSLALAMTNIPFLFMQDLQSELEEHDDSYQMEVKEEVVMDHNNYKVEDEMDTMVERRMRLQRVGKPTLSTSVWAEFALQKATNHPGAWACTDCSFEHKRRGFLLNHVEKEHMPADYPGYGCMRCNAVVAKSYHGFYGHMKNCMDETSASNQEC